MVGGDLWRLRLVTVGVGLCEEAVSADVEDVDHVFSIEKVSFHVHWRITAESDHLARMYDLDTTAV